MGYLGVSYDAFTGSFLSKITEFDIIDLCDWERKYIIDGYLKRALSAFKKNCRHDLFTTANDEDRSFDVEIPEDEIDEIVDIVSEGMVVQWLKPYVYRQELLESSLTTRDFVTYSPAELLMRINDTYRQAKKDYDQMVKVYSYNTSNLSDLHL